MGWFSKLFKKKANKQTEVEKDISEPVLSFVECVRNNPKRFRIEHSSILDRQTQETFSIQRVYVGCYTYGSSAFSYRPIKNTSWMTNDELEYAYNSVWAVQQDKVTLYKDKQRQKYISIYKEG